MISFTVSGAPLETYAGWFKPETLKARIHKIMGQALVKGEARSINLCPVDTGYMQSKIFAKQLAYNLVLLGCDCPYAAPNEFGWSKIPPIGDIDKPVFYKGGYRPFIRPGIWEMTRFLDKRLLLLFYEL